MLSFVHTTASKMHNNITPKMINAPHIYLNIYKYFVEDYLLVFSKQRPFSKGLLLFF